MGTNAAKTGATSFQEKQVRFDPIRAQQGCAGTRIRSAGRWVRDQGKHMRRTRHAPPVEAPPLEIQSP
jgi:hypothetical protein